VPMRHGKFSAGGKNAFRRGHSLLTSGALAKPDAPSVLPPEVELPYDGMNPPTTTIS